MKPNLNNWYFVKVGGHVKVRVFCNGALCGALLFQPEEFQTLVHELPMVNFISEGSAVKDEHEEYLKKIGFNNVV